jgi:hypothetical protein
VATVCGRLQNQYQCNFNTQRLARRRNWHGAINARRAYIEGIIRRFCLGFGVSIYRFANLCLKEMRAFKPLYDFPKSVYDFPKCVYDFPKCVYDFPKCVYDFPKCVYDFSKCVYDFPKCVYDFPKCVYDFPKY